MKDRCSKEDKEYYDKKLEESGVSLKRCLYCLIGMAVMMLLSAILQGCKTSKVIESTNTSDTLRTEIVEKIIKDTVTVTVEVPAEAKERETRDSTSFLETSFARSTASLKWQGDVPFLFHSLENKPQQIKKPVEVESKEKIKTVYRTRYKTKYKEVIQELPWWKKALMWAGVIETGLILFVVLGCWVIGKHPK